MKMTEAHYKWIAHLFPKPRKRHVVSNLEVLNALLYVMENGSKWRALPSEFGDWHTIYVRVNRWAKSGLLQNVFLHLQRIGVIKVNVRIVAIDSTIIKVHPDGIGALKKVASNLSENHVADTPPNFIWSPHLSETR